MEETTPEIVYLGASKAHPYRYDNQGFSSYPQRQGWDKAELLEFYFFEHRLKRDKNNSLRLNAAAFIQSWLFFGLLGELIGDKFALADFLHDHRNERGDTLVTTKQLGRYIKVWSEQVGRLDAEERRQKKENTERVIKEAHKHVSYYICSEGPYTDDEDFIFRDYPEIALSIMILGDTLNRASTRIYSDSSTSTQTEQAPTLFWGHSRMLDDHLKNAGWCPSDVSMFKRRLSSCGLHYLRLLPPRGRQRNHKFCHRGVCLAYQIDEEEYHTKHTTPNCICLDGNVPVSQMCDILRQGDIPIITLVLEEGKSVTVNIRAAKPNEPYVAISHVWADGLGNVRRNSLPNCQLLRLFSFVKELEDKTSVGAQAVHIWIDTLCVPQDNQDERLTYFRRLAIRKMKQTFENASKVLVLDAELDNTTLPASQDEVLLRIISASWFRRLWTLQEGVVARELLFQFGDGAVNVSQMIRVLQEQSHRHVFQAPAIQDAVNFCEFVLDINKGEGRKRITQILRAVQWRSTSRLSDETICLASLLELDLKALEKASDNRERWKIFLTMQRLFPQDILFSRWPRPDEHGFRWAPSSFVDSNVVKAEVPGDDSFEGKPLADVAKDGLNITAPGLFLLPHRGPLDTTIWVLNETDSEWYLLADGRGDSSRKWADIAEEVMDVQKPALIFDGTPRPQPGSLAILVDVYKEVDGVLYSKHLCRCWIRREPENAWDEYYNSLSKETKPSTQFGNRYFRYTRGKGVSSDQRWCVG